MRKTSQHYTYVPDAVMLSDRLTYEEKLTYYALLSLAKKEDCYQAAYMTVANRAGLDRNVVTDALKSLAAHGLISIERVPREANIYRLNDIPATFTLDESVELPIHRFERAKAGKSMPEPEKYNLQAKQRYSDEYYETVNSV